MHRKNSRLALRQLILPGAIAGIFALSAPSGVHAQQAPAAGNVTSLHDYNLQAAPLVQTLEAIEKISGRRIDFNRADLAQGRAKAVNGNLNAAAAISQALAGTGYVVQDDGVGALAVTPLATVNVVARRDQAETDFKADRSDTATRSGTSLQLVPGSVTIITSKVLESQQATDVTEALRNVSGVTFRKTPQAAMAFDIRGFTSTSNTNGVTDSSAADRSVFSVERIEVLKGPQAILSGGDSLGGAVNIVVKKPQAETIRDLTVQYGSHDDWTTALDLSGVAGSDSRFTYRTVASAQDARVTENGMNGKNSKSFMQAFRWKDKSTDFIANADYSNSKDPLAVYTFARRDGVILPVPDRLLGNRADGFDTVVRRVGYQLEQKLGANVVLISRLQRSKKDFDLHISGPNGLTYARDASPDSPDPLITFYAGRQVSSDQTTSGDHYLRFNLATGQVRHKLSVGFNHSDYQLDKVEYRGASVKVPVYSTIPYVFEDVRDRASRLDSGLSAGGNQRGAYVQDLMSYQKWNFLLNLRRTRYTVSESAGIFYDTPENFVYTDPAFSVYHTTPGAGIVYQLNDKTSLYASVAEGFVPTNDLACGGGFAPPNITRNSELGAKFDLLDGRFSLTTSAFSLQQSNRLVYNQLNDCYDVRDATRTRGVEIDAQGRLLPGLDAIFNYTYTRIKDVGDATMPYIGKPKHKANLWATYKFQGAELKGFGAGLGIAASSSSDGDFFEPFTVPGSAQVDASLFYTSGPWSATLGVKNVLDRNLYSTASANDYVPVLPGRTFALTVKRSFQ